MTPLELRHHPVAADVPREAEILEQPHETQATARDGLRAETVAFLLQRSAKVNALHEMPLRERAARAGRQVALDPYGAVKVRELNRSHLPE